MSLTIESARHHIESRLEEVGIPATAIDIRDYPDETIFVVRVGQVHYDKAIQLGGILDRELEAQGFVGFITVRKSVDRELPSASGEGNGVADVRAAALANLLAARSRTTEVQPSLTYIPDSANNIASIVGSRNHLVFGRRGAGKTSLLVEAKRAVESEGNLAIWLNVQTYRHEGAARGFVWLAKAVLDKLTVHFRDRQPAFMTEISSLNSATDELLAKDSTTVQQARHLLPRLQRVLRQALAAADARLYVFLDDLHYLALEEQPLFLDMAHGIVRDIDAWLKVASIRHLSRWFQRTPPMGLQTGHDADHIDLDLTLENPTDAKKFLDAVLDSFASHAGFRNAYDVFSEEALNRLVLAAGAVPRDYLVLAGGAIRQASRRPRARHAGVQDVNRAAGEQSMVKLTELEDDAAATGDAASGAIVMALNVVRAFCLDSKRYTYFRVDFRDKETRADEYALVTALLDVRLLHLVSASLSDKHQAGRRSEVFMLDLSQFSGQRLKMHLNVLDFVDDHIVLKKTGTEPRVGDTSKKLQDLLRRGPVFDLSRLAPTAIDAAAIVLRSEHTDVK